MTPAERAKLVEAATRLIGRRTDVQVIEDFTVGCIENRRCLKAEDWDGFAAINQALRWLEDEIDRRFPANAETIIESAWEIADRG